MSTKVDIDHLRKWIGKIDNVTDYVTPIVEQRYRATLNMDIGNPKDGEPVTSGLHWMLGWNLVKNDELGVDSHPALGEFLPPVPLPRRMWAGSEIKVLKPIRVGDKVVKQSTVADIQVKEGRTGLLCFVTAEYNFLVNDEVTINEKHNIVYRDISKSGGGSGYSKEIPERADLSEKIFMHPTILFRYSAIGFVGHRIHYDHPYTVNEENYPGLIVHGPLQATYLLRAAEKLMGKQVKSFTHKVMAPVFANSEYMVGVDKMDDGSVSCWGATKEFGVTMRAEAKF
jgi:3-methylfumaryl-CoA hydratase|tara:strand:- start:888 stop:1739 length:852 start_codon:yes stop_codon:yes gene_type:complete